MRHCTQQVRPHFLHLTFFLEHFLILYLACNTTGDKRNGYHDYPRCDIFRNKKIYLEIRKCKCKIHYYHADYRCQYSIHISVSEHRYQKYRKHHDGRYQYVCSKCCLYYQTQSNPYCYHHQHQQRIFYNVLTFTPLIFFAFLYIYFFHMYQSLLDYFKESATSTPYVTNDIDSTSGARFHTFK